MLIGTATFEEVVQVVRQWSPAQRFSLVQAIFQSLVSESKPATNQRKNTVAKARGLLATASRPPTDAQVKEWLTEQRLEKYS